MALARQRRAQVPIMIASFLAWSQGRADFSEPHPQVLEQRCVVDLFDLIDLSLGVGLSWGRGRMGLGVHHFHAFVQQQLAGSLA